MIVRESPRRLDQASLEGFLLRAQRALKVKGAVTVLITTSQEMRALNRRFRAKDKATDVLSFPAAEVVRGYAAGALAISAEIAAQRAAELGHSFADELRILMLHGLLHLAGYDHEADNGEMAKREMRLRKTRGLPVALIERAVLPAGAAPNARAAIRNQPLPRARSLAASRGR